LGDEISEKNIWKIEFDLRDSFNFGVVKWTNLGMPHPKG
jgi:hypothetical protein